MHMILNPEYTTFNNFVSSLPSIFKEEGECIYKSRNEIKIFPVQGLTLTVKSFKIPSFFNRIVYTFIRHSKARRSYEHAQVLLQKGIDTPNPVAFVEKKRAGLLYDSYYVSLFRESTGMMRELRKGALEEKKELIRAFALFSAFLHEQNVLHIDYSPGNILYTHTSSGYTFFLLDINRMKFSRVSMEAGCKNLRRLWGSDEMIAYMAGEYAKARNFDVEESIRLTLFYHRKFWKKFSKKHGRTPYDHE